MEENALCSSLYRVDAAAKHSPADASGPHSPLPNSGDRLLPAGEVPASLGAHYREMAGKLRAVAREARFAGTRKEVLQLAAKYERRADYLNCR